MTTPIAAALLSRLFEGRERDALSYDLNVELRCRTWWPPLPLPWKYREAELPPALRYMTKDEDWQTALALLNEFPAQYRATHPKRGTGFRADA